MPHAAELYLPNLRPAYRTEGGAAYLGDSLELLKHLPDDSVQLVMTSPPFALLRPQKYGNRDEAEYVEWLAQFAALVKQKLRPDGSFVLDLGGAYRRGIPSRSLYNFRVLLKFCDELGFHRAEDFYWFNLSKLPSPIDTDSVCFVNKLGKRQFANSTPGTRSSHSRSASQLCKSARTFIVFANDSIGVRMSGSTNAKSGSRTP
ncbi:hypothetical protein DESA109040_12560 [Deinococcus saxicola]|uniref:DNA methyltransferase n=1 Tax=Deinococcus saxicola TaxID=249406 RepID=UPI0039EFE888